MVPLSFDSILAARRRIRQYLPPSPLVYSMDLSAQVGTDVWLKMECRQPTGSFKVRGALNKIGLLTDEEKAHGLVTGSAGNHGLGVAFAVRTLGSVQADIFVPANAPRAKIDRIRAFGIGLHEMGQSYEEAHQAAESFARDTGAIYVPAYDDLDVIAGQGTMGIEILEELPDTGTILVPVGGGGMLAGVAIAAATMAPGCHVAGVQPAASPSAWLSLRDGVAYDPYDNEPTIADGLAGGFGALPFEIVQGLVRDIFLVSEMDLRRAVFRLVDKEQIITEPSGAVTIAALTNGLLQHGRKPVVCVLSGANIETALLRDILIEYSA